MGGDISEERAFLNYGLALVQGHCGVEFKGGIL